MRRVGFPAPDEALEQVLRDPPKFDWANGRCITVALMSDSKLEQYKSYLSDLNGIGTRYAAANAFYVSVLTALV